MKKIKDYIYESLPFNHQNYITNDKINNLEDLIKIIKSNLSPTLKKYLLNADIPVSNIVINNRDNLLFIESGSINLKSVGFLGKYIFNSITIQGSSTIQYDNTNNKFLYHPILKIEMYVQLDEPTNILSNTIHGIEPRFLCLDPKNKYTNILYYDIISDQFIKIK